MNGQPNIDMKTVEGFGEEWSAFDQAALEQGEYDDMFAGYFACFPLADLADAEGFDLGCGSGRWAAMVAPKVGKLHCIDASEKALAVARRRLEGVPNVAFHHASVDAIPLPDGSQDFGYSLGVLHHIPDTQAAMNCCVAKLKRGAPFLVYLYYDLEERPFWYRALWKASDVARVGISRLPFRLRKGVSGALALVAYLPLARTARMLERRGFDVEKIPLSYYRNRSFYSMRTDALDRFGTRLEQRFSRSEIRAMMEKAGLRDVVFGSWGRWIACGWKV